MSLKSDARNLLWMAAVGLIVAILTGAVTAPLFAAGVGPMPQPPSLAFAETLLGDVAKPVGFLFHLVYVTAVTIVVLRVFGRRPSVRAIVGSSLALWAIAVVVFFPIVGWGVFGAAVSPKIGVAALGPHVLYGVLLYLGTRVVFRAKQSGQAHA